MGDFRDIYDVLAQWRRGLRSFLMFSERSCAQYGATPAMYQLMLVLKTARGPVDIQMAATALSLAHHSAAELVQKAEAAAFVGRAADPADARRSMLSLTELGEQAVAALARDHAAFLRQIRAESFDILRELDGFLAGVSGTVTSGAETDSSQHNPGSKQ